MECWNVGFLVLLFNRTWMHETGASYPFKPYHHLIIVVFLEMHYIIVE